MLRGGVAATLARDSSAERRKEGNAPCLRGMEPDLGVRNRVFRSTDGGANGDEQGRGHTGSIYHAGAWIRCLCHRCGAVRVQAGEQAGVYL